MVLWLVLVLMTAAAVGAVLWPLVRNKPLRTGSDVAVYRDQLEEIDRDRADGRIGEQEADAARVEVSRRLIAAAEATPTVAPAGDTHWRQRMLALCVLVFLPIGSIGLYLALGAPDLQGRPQAVRADRATDEEGSILEMVARVESHLATNPEDGRGWEVIGPAYMRLGRFDEAIKARRNTLRLLGTNAERLADLGESLVVANNGIVTEEAKKAFEAASTLSADDFRTRYFMGLAAEQNGQKDKAAEVWRKLLADAPPDAGWLDLVRESLARVDPNAPAVAQRGPSAADVAAASSLTPDQQKEMAEGMVARLAERLKRDGTDVDGWMLLVRSWLVLGAKDKANEAVVEARAALAGDAEKLRRIDDMARAMERAEAVAPQAPRPSQQPMPPAPPLTSQLTPQQPGPTAEDMAAARQLTPGQQNEMIQGMVARLADRLKQDGSDVEGWLRLVRAYTVLGDEEKSRAALGDARRALASDPEKLQRFNDLAKGLGIEG